MLVGEGAKLDVHGCKTVDMASSFGKVCSSRNTHSWSEECLQTTLNKIDGMVGSPRPACHGNSRSWFPNRTTVLPVAGPS